ncbi:virulence RhuM family protein [Belliella kenyensis]|uniref:Virulence RhuM family protein n=1 Tax=Belliella kenyensis TaxID=1472724 RepID=A0ABV8EKS5_9BACT|nr:virulence RhuM family protein [Belliella kenyensis]MCH7401358.1 virulence RhuM family protein [Belliella kenyensis]MDN3602801.1 virulence RhuM family protein [Belliella kenyensis]
MSELTPKQNNFILYTTPEGEVKLNVLLENETIWLTQEQMSQLFDRERSVITKHIGNVFSEGELEEKSNVQILHISGSDKPVKFYNLDVIISVGYRVKSQRGTQFRIWATKTLKEYIIKGFVLDDNRLKQGEAVFGKDYFKELLERVRSIRANERRIYQQITDIFAECSIDYDPKAEITKNFYAMVQNKFHFAITGQTAAEIIYKYANAKKENMGLTTWKNAPEGRILKSDTTIAKNYLQEKEIKQLERTVTGYFDYIENLIERENTFTMESLANSVDKFLNFNEFKILEGKGTKSHGQAISKAGKEYEQFNKTQKIISDFDKQIKKLKD